MFKGRWSAIFAFGLVVGGAIAIVAIVWIIGLNYCPNQPCYYDQTADDPNYNAGERVWQVPDAVRGTFSYETEPEYSPGNPTEYEYYDLRAQERMAHATDWIVWLTLATGGVGLIGLGAIIYTLNLQRSANEIMRDEQRPWLHASIGEVKNYRFQQNSALDRDDTAHFELPIMITNSGGSPAVDVAIECRAGPLSLAIEKMWGEINAPIDAGVLPISIGAVPPGFEQFKTVWVHREVPEPKEGYSDIVPISVIIEIVYRSTKSQSAPLFHTVQAFEIKKCDGSGNLDFISPVEIMSKDVTISVRSLRSHMA